MRDLFTLVRGWTGGRFLFDSGYYAGRPPTTSDLDSDILERLYQGIKRDIGDEAAVAFVRFVNALDDLSASAFIVAFERFAHGDFKEVLVPQDRKDRMHITAHGGHAEAQAFAGVMSALASRNMSEAEREEKSHAIKANFLQKHRAEIPEQERRRIAGSWA